MRDIQPDIVVFDIGNVLLDWSPDHLYAKVIAQPSVRKWFLDTVCTYDWNREQDRGRSYAEAVAERRALWPEWRDEIEAWHHRWLETLSGPIAGSVDILHRLKAAGAPCYAITNFPAEKFPAAQEIYPFLKGFDGVIVSGDEGLVKPDREIYDCLLARYGLDAHRCVFIDDVAANVEGARAAGMKGIWFQNPAQLARDLRSFGFDV